VTTGLCAVHEMKLIPSAS